MALTTEEIIVKNSKNNPALGIFLSRLVIRKFIKDRPHFLRRVSEKHLALFFVAEYAYKFGVVPMDLYKDFDRIGRKLNSQNLVHEALHKVTKMCL